MIRLFVTDLDGTLLNASKRIDDRDRFGMEALVNAGVQRCLASGRLRTEMVRVAEKVGGPFHLICQNGAHVETADGRTLAQCFFEACLAVSIYHMVSSWDALAVVCMPDRDVIAERTERAIFVEKRLFAPFTTIPALSQRIGHDLTPTKFSIFGDRNVLEQLGDALRTTFPNQIATFRSDVDCLDIMPAAVSKGASLRVLMEELHLTASEVACIGDSYNDLSMFGVARHSFAMQHAEAAIRGKASHVSECVGDAAAQVIHRNMCESTRV